MEHEPPRLIHDPELDAALRSDLERAASASPPALDLAAGLASLEAAIGADGGAGPEGAGPESGSPGGGPSAGPSTVGPWLAGAGALILILAGAAWWATGSEHEPSRVSDPMVAEASQPEAETPSEEEPVAVPESPALEPAAPPLDPPAAPEPAEGATSSARRARAPRAPIQRSDPNALREEMLLLERARQALGTDPTQALRITDESRRRFPAGVFAEERDGIAALAALRSNRRGAARRARRFLRAHPRGSMSDRVRAALEDP